MTDSQTTAFYDAKAADYAALELPEKVYAPCDAFIARLPAGGRILDLGCGPGNFSGHMASAGLSVEAWDVSQSMVDLAAAYDGVDARLAGFDDLTQRAAFDGIWANFSLLHAVKADMPKHLDNIAQALKQGGVFHIAMKVGAHEERDTLGRFYAYYSEDELRDLLIGAGLSVVDTRRGEMRGMAGAMEPFVTFQAIAGEPT